MRETLMDRKASSGVWVCSHCAVEQAEDATYCNLCQFARPLDRRGAQQIFSGYVIHFNGIIPRTVMHPSHSVEWRMAERHGAICSTVLDPAKVNIVVYRPGYERSEKCRACIERYGHISCVPIDWLLDSLLQSRQIHPSLYLLTNVPAVAKPTVRGIHLPHHQHPYYQINKDEYAIPTSFPPRNKSVKGAAGKERESQKVLAGSADSVADVPPFFDIEPCEYTVVDVFEAAVSCATGLKTDACDGEDDNVEVRRENAGIELIAAQQSRNRIDRMLFSGMTVLLPASLQRRDALVTAIQRCGGKIAKDRGSLEATLRGEVTHVIYTRDDKKSDVMIEAAHLITTTLPGLQLAQLSWLEDCLILGELLPLYGMYTPTAKLMETLNKKYSKAR